jgi:hypothetical protein
VLAPHVQPHPVLLLAQDFRNPKTIIPGAHSVDHQFHHSFVQAGTTLSSVVQNRHLQLFEFVFDDNFGGHRVVVARDWFLARVVVVVASRIQFSFDLFSSVGIRIESTLVGEVAHREPRDHFLSFLVHAAKRDQTKFPHLKDLLSEIPNDPVELDVRVVFAFVHSNNLRDFVVQDLYKLVDETPSCALKISKVSSDRDCFGLRWPKNIRPGGAIFTTAVVSIGTGVVEEVLSDVEFLSFDGDRFESSTGGVNTESVGLQQNHVFTIPGVRCHNLCSKIVVVLGNCLEGLVRN